MILTMTKYHENLLRDSPLSLLFIVKIFSSLETKMVLKTPNETFLRITRYIVDFPQIHFSTRKLDCTDCMRPLAMRLENGSENPDALHYVCREGCPLQI